MMDIKKISAIAFFGILFAFVGIFLAQNAQDTADSANNTANSVNTSSFQNMSTVDELKVNRISKNNVWDGYLGGYYIELNSRIHCIFNMCDFTSKNNYGGLAWYEPQDIQLYWGNKSISLDNTSAHIKNASLDMHGNTIINSPSLTINNASIQINESQVTNLTSDLNAKVNKSGDNMTGVLYTHDVGSFSALNGSSTSYMFFTVNRAFYGETPATSDWHQIISGRTGSYIGLENNNLVFNTFAVGSTTPTMQFKINTLTDNKITALCIDANELVYRSTNATSGYLTC